MEDGLVLLNCRMVVLSHYVLILIVMEDGLVLLCHVSISLRLCVLILVVVDNGLVLVYANVNGTQVPQS